MNNFLISEGVLIWQFQRERPPSLKGICAEHIGILTLRQWRHALIAVSLLCHTEFALDADTTKAEKQLKRRRHNR